MMAHGYLLMLVVLLALALQLAGAERSQESKGHTGLSRVAAADEAVSFTARAAGVRHRSKNDRNQRKRRKAAGTELQQSDLKSSSPDDTVNDGLGGNHVGDYGESISDMVQKVGKKIGGSLGESAAKAMEESKKYQDYVMELHQDLEGFGKQSEELQGDLRSEHEKKVNAIDDVIKTNMVMPGAPQEPSLVDLSGSGPASAGSSSMLQMPGVPANPFVMQQNYPMAYGPPTFVASQLSGPPPAALFPPAAMSEGDDQDETLLSPEFGF
jgi:hypothetical protein